MGRAFLAATIAITVLVVPTAATTVRQAGAEAPYIEPVVLDNVFEDSAGFRQHRDNLRGISDDGQRVLVMTVANWQVFRRIEVSERGRATPHKLVDFHATLIGSPTSLSGDGRYVAFTGYDPDARQMALYRWDIDGASVEQVALLGEDSGPLRLSSISTNGRYIFSATLVGRSRAALFRYDMTTGDRLEIGFAHGLPHDGEIAIAGNGRRLLYRVPAGTALLDLETGSDELLPAPAATEGPSTSLAISPNGRYVAYGGTWRDLDTGTHHQIADWWPEDRVGRSTVASSLDNSGNLTFSTTEALVARDTNGVEDIYYWSVGAALQLISVSDLGTQLELPSHSTLLSANGEWAAFGTHAQSAHDTSRHQPEEWWNDAIFLRAIDGRSPADAGVVAAALRPGGGYWTVNRAGRVVGHEGARVLQPRDAEGLGFGAWRPRMSPGEEVTSIESTSTGLGYWLFTNRGRAVAFGDADFFGDLTDIALSGPIIDSAPLPSDDGYYMVGADGGVFAFGAAEFHGSVPGVLGPTPLNQPIVALVATDAGYRMVAADGGVFSFGDAEFHGSVPGVLGPETTLAQPIVGMVAGADGYLNVAADGGIFNFGNSEFHGSLGDNPPEVAISAVLVVDDGGGYVMFDRNGNPYAFGNGLGLLAG